MSVQFRDGTVGDCPEIYEIQAEAIRTGTASFSLEPPPQREIEARLARLVEQDLPFKVAASDKGIVGYSFADWFRPRPGYRFTLEDSIYVDPQFHGQGLGKRLLTAVIEDAAENGYKQMIAVIGDIENVGSIALHKACGFQYSGVLKNVGFKFDRWLDTIYMQRAL